MFKPMESGTHGRRWYTDKKDNIAFSFLWETNCEIHQLEGLTVEIAQTMLAVFENLYGVSLCIKSPNDLVYRGKKLGGILTETKLQKEIVKYVVIGIRVEYKSRSF